MSDIEARISASFSQIIRFGPSDSILQRGVSLLAAFAFEKEVIADLRHLKEARFSNLPTEIVFGNPLPFLPGFRYGWRLFRAEGLTSLF
jgi:hypothetical protein